MAPELRQFRTVIAGGRKTHIHSAGSNFQTTTGYRRVLRRQEQQTWESMQLGTGENSKYMMFSEQKTHYPCE